MARGKRRGFEDISSYTSNKMVKRNQKKKHHRGLKILLGVMFSLCILMGILMMAASKFLLGGLRTTEISGRPEALGITSGTYTDSKIKNILLFGVDTRGGSGAFSGNSDVIMVVSVDQRHNKIKLSSILRDARVYMGELTPYESGYDKLNGAYAYGGPEAAIRVINENYGLDVKDYVTVNFAATAKIVNAVGGVEVELTDAEIEQLNLNLTDLASSSPDSLDGPATPYTGSAGMAQLDGNQAVAYGRIRAIDSDNVRAERQQAVISSAFDRLTRLSPLQYPGVLRELLSICETSLDLGELLGLSTFAASDFTVERLSIPSNTEGYDFGYYEGEMWMWNYDLPTAAAHLHRFIYEDGA